MLYITCTMISSVDPAHNRTSRAKDWATVNCGTNHFADGNIQSSNKTNNSETS